MNVIICSEDDILRNIGGCKNNHIVLSVKSNLYINNIVRFAVLVDDSIYIAENIIDQTLFIKSVVSLIEKRNLEVFVFDLKYIYRIILKKLGYTTHIQNFKDIKLCLYNKYNKKHDLSSDIIRDAVESYNESVKKKYSQDVTMIDFQKKILGLENYAWEIIKDTTLNNILVLELLAINRLKQIFDHENIHVKDLNRLSYYYAVVENSEVAINTDEVERIGYDNVKRYFVDYIEYSKFANIKYYLDHTKTGRIISNFNVLPKKYGKIVKSRFKRGQLVSIDFNSFEFKILCHLASVACREIDPYSELSFQRRHNRDIIKENVIRWMYGSKKYNEELIDLVNSKYPILKWTQDIKKIASEKLQVVFSNSKVIKYNTKEEAARKVVNNVVQSYSTEFITHFMTNVIDKMMAARLESVLFANIIDEFLFDVESNTELTCLANILNTCLKDSNNVFDTNITMSSKIGNNLMELKS